jgi:hypothetical protein
MSRIRTNILVLGARIKPLRIRLNRAEKQSGFKDRIYILGNDPWPQYAVQKYTHIPGYSSIETLTNFKNLISSNNQVLVVSCWYHLPRCWLILRRLGFRKIQLVPSTWKWWKVRIRTLKNEIRSLKGFLF